MPDIREIGPYQEEPTVKEIGPYKAAQSIREIGPYEEPQKIREIGPLRPEKKPRPAPSFMELQQGFGVLPAIGLKAVQGAATAIDKVFGDTEAEKEQQRRDTSGAMIEESTPANIALGLAGAKGLSMLTKTRFAPVNEAVEAVTQLPISIMPWQVKTKAEALGILPTKPSSKAIQAIDAMYDASEKEISTLHKVNIPNILRKAKTRLVDTSGNVKEDLKKLGPIGEDAAIRHDLARGASAITDMELDKYRRSIYEGLSHDDERQLNRIIASRRTVSIGKYKDVANTKGFTPEHHAEYLKALAESDPQRFKALNERADQYFGVMQEQLGKMKQAGLLDDASYQALLAKGDYSPRRFIQYIDPEQNYTFGGTKLTVPSSGIKALKEGSEQAMENNSRLLMAEVVSRTNARIMKNSANQELFKLAQEVPDNGLVHVAIPKRKLFYNGKEVADDAIIVDTYIDGERKQYSAGKIAKMVENVRNAEDQAVLKRISKQYQKYKWGMSEPTPTAGNEIVAVMVNGKRHYLEMPSDIAKEWVLSDPQISKQLSSAIGWLSGSKILKPMATGLNPEFAVTNFARDLAHIFLTTDEYSSFLPKAVGQQAVDLVSTAKDAVLRKGDYLKYVQQGGGMEFLTHQGRPGLAGSALDKLYGVMGYLGETTEIWSRLALRKRALKNAAKEGIDPARAEMRATYAARNYLDFSQGGSFVKAADSAIPYLNAAIQGTRGVFRYAADHPGKFTYKVGQIGTMAAGLYYANRMTNPEAWEQVPDREKASNFIFTTPLYYYDKNGDKRYYYFKVAKDQSQRIFASIFENLAAASIGDTFKSNQLSMAFEDGLPIVPTGVLPPTIEAMLGYAANKNFWRNEDIWRGRKGIDPSQEYNRYTPEAYVKLGEATGMSPERTKYALEQVFTSGNIWTSLTGGAMSAMLGELPKDMRDQTMQEMISKAPFIRKALRSTDPFAPYQQESEGIKRERATKRAVVRREFDAIADEYARGRISKEEAVEFINTQPREQRRYFLRQLNEKKSLTGIPDGRWWRDLQYQDAGTRAEMFHRRYERASDEEKERLDRQLYKLKSIRSKEFNAELRRLRNENQ